MHAEVRGQATKEKMSTTHRVAPRSIGVLWGKKICYSSTYSPFLSLTFSIEAVSLSLAFYGAVAYMPTGVLAIFTLCCYQYTSLRSEARM